MAGEKNGMISFQELRNLSKSYYTKEKNEDKSSYYIKLEEIIKRTPEKQKIEIIKDMKLLLNIKTNVEEEFLIKKFCEKFKNTFNNNTSIREKIIMRNFILKIREHSLNEIYSNILRQNKGISGFVYKSEFIPNFIKDFLLKDTRILDKKLDFSKESVDLMDKIKADFKENQYNTINKLLRTSTREKGYGSSDPKPGEMIVSIFQGINKGDTKRIKPLKNYEYELKEVSPNHIIVCGIFENKTGLEYKEEYKFFEVKTRTYGNYGGNHYDSDGVRKN